jgi:hypothetical protein
MLDIELGNAPVHGLEPHHDFLTSLGRDKEKLSGTLSPRAGYIKVKRDRELGQIPFQALDSPCTSFRMGETRGCFPNASPLDPSQGGRAGKCQSRANISASIQEGGFDVKDFRQRIRAVLAAMLLILTPLGQVALAQSSITTSPGSMRLLESYIAYIGHHDLYNSRGQRLTEPWQIIRQDRANFHRFGHRDGMDEWDSFFASAANREQLETMLRRGYISPQAARDIVRGGVVIQVEIYGQGSVARAVHVTVNR